MASPRIHSWVADFKLDLISASVAKIHSFLMLYVILHIISHIIFCAKLQISFTLPILFIRIVLRVKRDVSQQVMLEPL